MPGVDGYLHAELPDISEDPRAGVSCESSAGSAPGLGSDNREPSFTLPTLVIQVQAQDTQQIHKNTTQQINNNQ